MLDDFILRALVAGIGVAVVVGALGCFVVWRRMAYFGDSLAHSSLLGIALGLLYGFSINIGIIIVCSVFAILLVWLQYKHVLATDTLLGILAHASLSLGMVALSFLDYIQFDLHSYLFGDILTVSNQDLVWIYAGGALVLGLLIFNWSSLTLMTIHEDLAKAEGVKTFRTQLLLMFLMTIVVAFSVRIVGILLITSLLIIPAATARQLSRTPEAMAIIASMLGVLAVLLGMYGSMQFDTPSGPSIVTAASFLFLLLFPSLKLLKRMKPNNSSSKGKLG